MIVLRIRDGDEKLVRAMGIWVTIRRVAGREVEIGVRYADGTKAAIPETIVAPKEKTAYNSAG